MAGGANASAGVGSGGMATKIEAARIALTAGCSTLITLGANTTADAGPISAHIGGTRGTWFLTDLSPETARRPRPSGPGSMSGLSVAALRVAVKRWRTKATASTMGPSTWGVQRRL